MKENIFLMTAKVSIFYCFMLLCYLLISACGKREKTADKGQVFAPNMYESEAYKVYDQNSNFKDGITMQSPPKNTIPIGHSPMQYDASLASYKLAGVELKNPLEANQENILKGKTLYISMCSPCHGMSGKGDGAIIKAEKFPPPPSYSNGVSSRGGNVNDLKEGQLYHTIYHGLNLMGSFASHLDPTERWQVILYVQQLQQK